MMLRQITKQFRTFVNNSLAPLPFGLVRINSLTPCVTPVLDARTLTAAYRSKGHGCPKIAARPNRHVDLGSRAGLANGFA